MYRSRSRSYGRRTAIQPKTRADYSVRDIYANVHPDRLVVLEKRWPGILNQQDPRTGDTLWHVAARHLNQPILDALFAAGANPSIQNKKKQYPHQVVKQNGLPRAKDMFFTLVDMEQKRNKPLSSSKPTRGRSVHRRPVVILRRSSVSRSRR